MTAARRDELRTSWENAVVERRALERSSPRAITGWIAPDNTRGERDWVVPTRGQPDGLDISSRRRWGHIDLCLDAEQLASAARNKEHPMTRAGKVEVPRAIRRHIDGGIPSGSREQHAAKGLELTQLMAGNPLSVKCRATLGEQYVLSGIMADDRVLQSSERGLPLRQGFVVCDGCFPGLRKCQEALVLQHPGGAGECLVRVVW